MKKTVAIIFGGNSTEYEVSLKSAYSVVSHINKEKYNIVLIGITRDGKWYRFNGDYEKIKNNTWLDDNCTRAIISPDSEIQGIMEFSNEKITTTHIDVIFPMLHGRYGEDGCIQGLFEMANIPYVGCGVLSSSVCMDKYISHKLVSDAGIKVADSVFLNSILDEKDIINKTSSLKYPLFVKPINSGSSFGITRVEKQEDIYNAVKIAFEHDNKVIIEEEIKGFEVGCAIIGGESLIIGQVDEIELTDGFFDFNEKYTLETSAIHMPARIQDSIAEQIKKTALEIYKILNCFGIARVDMFLTPNNEIVFNEVNTMPGFTPNSRYPNMLKSVNISFEEIIDKLLEVAINK